MKISHRLIVQSVAATVALLGVGSLGLLGVRHTQQELHVMTGDILPLKNKLLEIERSKEQTMGSLLALSYAENSEVAQHRAAEAQANLEELQIQGAEISSTAASDVLDIAVFIDTRDNILENIDASFAGYSTYIKSAAAAQDSLKKVSRTANAVSDGIQSIANDANNSAKSARSQSDELIEYQQVAHQVSQSISEINVMLFSVDAVESKYKIEPLENKLGILSARLTEFSQDPTSIDILDNAVVKLQDAVSDIGRDEKGLIALRLAILEKNSKAKFPYRKLRRTLEQVVEGATQDLHAVENDLELRVAAANENMDAALSLSSDPSSITAVNQKLAIGTRDLRIELQGLFDALSAKDLKVEHAEASTKVAELKTYAIALRDELLKLELGSLSELADDINDSLSEAQNAIEAVYRGKLAVFDSKVALAESIASLNTASKSQRQQGEKVLDDINNKLNLVIDGVDGEVKKSTSLIAVISLAAVAFSVIFSYITIRAILNRLQRALEVAETVSSGNLSPVEPSTHKDEVSSVLDALARMVSMLDNSVRQIRTASASVNHGAEEINEGNTALSARNGQQAQHLNDTASSTRKINELVQEGANAVQKASALSFTASEVAAEGKSVVQNAMRSMDNIESGAREISGIISVIDSIAFQTNILALNAAVEASRAGELGRGFAVVATEVRALAAKSKESANQIKAIIDNNVAEVEVGSALVTDAGNHIEDVVSKVDEVKQLIEGIANTTRLQVESIAHIDSSVDEIENMTKQNAGLSDQTSDAASNLLQQARSLDQAVSVFKL